VRDDHHVMTNASNRSVKPQPGQEDLASFGFLPAPGLSPRARRSHRLPQLRRAPCQQRPIARYRSVPDIIQAVSVDPEEWRARKAALGWRTESRRPAGAARQPRARCRPRNRLPANAGTRNSPAANFDAEKKRLDIEIDFKTGGRFGCPDCGKADCPVHDTDGHSPQVGEVHVRDGLIDIILDDAPQPRIVLADDTGRRRNRNGRYQRPPSTAAPGRVQAAIICDCVDDFQE